MTILDKMSAIGNREKLYFSNILEYEFPRMKLKPTIYSHYRGDLNGNLGVEKNHDLKSHSVVENYNGSDKFPCSS